MTDRQTIQTQTHLRLCSCQITDSTEWFTVICLCSIRVLMYFYHIGSDNKRVILYKSDKNVMKRKCVVLLG